MTEADRARADARLFARDAIRAARAVMSENTDISSAAAVLAVFAILAAAALGLEDASC
ncbi:hypothetical protein [Methylobacterium sp. yr596]|uniref:hypothetical protein n=1 Tax=Methylobacterium sp. yr596 TaxID=1761800 RepID=UPI0008DFDD7D|nr:hypothetical protein [Methylobacterium sp. yr596]SFE90496.1 hypothetical protein SAMN04487844_107140 [Methylobacterium sp. yr596]